MGIGELLRQMREKKGLSLGDVENATKIRARYIQALETEQYELIPGEVYRLGFLKNYARLLELDTEAVIASYKSATKAPSPDEGRERPRRRQRTPHSFRPGVSPDAEEAMPVSQRDTRFGKPGTRRGRPGRQASPVARRPAIEFKGMIAQAGSAFQNRRLLLGAAVVIILILLMVAGADLLRHTHLAAKQPPPQASKPPTVPSLVYSPQQTPPALEIRLVGTGHCWAEVKVDGVVAYQGTLKPGDTEIFDAQASIWMDLGYPESVDVYYNGNKLPPLGTTRPVTRTFTRNMGAQSP